MCRRWQIRCLLVLLAASPVAAQTEPPLAGDKTTPLILKLVRARLAATTDLRPADGVRIDSVKFARGILNLSGMIRTAAQRDKVKASIKAGQAAIENEADVKIKDIDVSGLEVKGEVLTVPPKPADKKEQPKPPAAKTDCTDCDCFDCDCIEGAWEGCDGIDCEWIDGGWGEWGWEECPPPATKKKHSWFGRHHHDDHHDDPDH
jgi:hypothetical protein